MRLGLMSCRSVTRNSVGWIINGRALKEKSNQLIARFVKPQNQSSNLHARALINTLDRALDKRRRRGLTDLQASNVFIKLGRDEPRLEPPPDHPRVFTG